jgi:hypothetical protein
MPAEVLYLFAFIGFGCSSFFMAYLCSLTYHLQRYGAYPPTVAQLESLELKIDLKNQSATVEKLEFELAQEREQRTQLEKQLVNLLSASIRE